jgi:hypothetical protein
VPQASEVPNGEPTGSDSVSESAVVTSSESVAVTLEPEIVITITPAETSEPAVLSQTGETLLEALQADPPKPQSDEHPLKIDTMAEQAQPDPVLETSVALGSEVQLEGPNKSLGIWLIGIGSIILIGIGIVRRFSGR